MRFNLEYGHVIWDLHLKKHINTLSNVQRLAFKLVNKRQMQYYKPLIKTNAQILLGNVNFLWLTESKYS